MSFRIVGKNIEQKLQRNLRHQQRDESDALDKLSSGKVFTQEDPRPADRALTENMEYRTRSLAMSKRNVNDAISLVQTAESALAEVSNTIVRMKELNTTAASSTISDLERRYLFIEYNALYDELNRVAMSTKYNGIPLLDPNSPNSLEELIFRVDDPTYNEDDEDINTIIFDRFTEIDTTTEGLGLMSAFELLEDSEEYGIDQEDALEFLLPINDDFNSIYDEVMNVLSVQRADFGSLLNRFHKIIDFNDVYLENISAAKSKISDTDFASTTAQLVQSRIGIEATTALIAQSNLPGDAVLSLIKALD
jgi:flagellin